MDATKDETSAGDIAEVIRQEILSSNVSSSVLGDLIIDIESLDVQERSPSPGIPSSGHPGFMFGDSSSASPDDFTSTLIDRKAVDPSAEPSVPSRSCQAFQIPYCRQLPYNLTTFPNAMGHKSVFDAKYDIDRFK